MKGKDMNQIAYTQEKKFTKEQVQKLFLSAGYVLVDPRYHGRGIAGHMVEMVKEKYKEYLYIEIMPEESKNAAFYQRFGFEIMPDGVAMQICNQGEKR